MNTTIISNQEQVKIQNYPKTRRRYKPETILKRFCDKTGTYKDKGFDMIHSNCGTVFAADGYRIAIILSRDKAEWALRDAQISTSGGVLSLYSFFEISDCIEKISITKSTAESIFTGCYEKQMENYEARSRMSRSEKYGKSRDAIVYLDFDNMALADRETAKNLHNDGKRIAAYNARYLMDLLEFAIGGKTDSIEVYYLDSVKQLIVKNDNLYTALMPIKF